MGDIRHTSILNFVNSAWQSIEFATDWLDGHMQELGGKSAMIVFEDADVDKAVEWAMVSFLQTTSAA